MSETDAKKPRIATRYEKMTAAGPLLLDGEIGGLLWKLVKEENKTGLVPASIILDEPEVVKKLHLDYIEAGAQVITTNTYATVKKRTEGLFPKGDQWEQMITTACRLAVEARECSGKEVLIAGTLPPLHGSYKPDQVGAMEEIVPVYEEHVEKMKDYVDVFLCETMSNAKEGRAAASAAKKSGKPVWVSWCIRDDSSATLRSGESIEEAYQAVADLNVDGVFVNCVSPENIAAAMPHLAKMGPKIIGGHGNGFTFIPENWHVSKVGHAALGKRRDLTPESYATMAEAWLDAGAVVVGGCCQVGVDYIAHLAKVMEKRAKQ